MNEERQISPGGRRLRVLYVERARGHHSLLGRIYNSFPEFKLSGQDGFLRASLHCVCDVTERPMAYLLRHADDLHREFDWVVVNFKAGGLKRVLNEEEVARIARIPKCRKALFINYAAASILPSDAVLDPFDLVFKREMFRDLERYPISPANRAKLCTTTLACLMVPAHRLNVRRIDPRRYGFDDVSRDSPDGVFFNGLSTRASREELLKFIVEAGVPFVGGLQPKQAALAPGVPYAPRMRMRDYVAQVRRSRINLALDGIGEFTFRHLEVWCCCAFLLSNSSIRALSLPLAAREGEHYVCFDSPDDLVEKARYYLDHPDARDRIARAGRALFERDYNFHKHGACLLERMCRV